MELVIRAAQPADREWTVPLLAERWGGTRVVSRGRVHDTADLPALVAERNSLPAGLLHYRLEHGACEIVTLDAVETATGAGSALVERLIEEMRRGECGRVWLITTNDNLDALRFYQRRGFSLVAVHRGAVDEARRLKPTIPLLGHFGIPIRDEIELERLP